MRFELAIFDWNGTLFNDLSMLYKAIVAIFKHYRCKPPTLEECRDGLSHNWIEFYRKCGLPKSVTPEELREFRRNFVNNNWKGIGLFRDAKSAIVGCLKMKMKLAIVSAEQADFLLSRLSHHQLLSSFSEVLSQSYDKKSAFLKVLKKLSIPAEKAFYVDDTADGILEAKEAGLATFGMTRGYNSPERIRAAKPTYVIDTLDEMVKILESEGGKV